MIDNFVAARQRFGPEYPKINTVFKRDMERGGVIMPDEFSTAEFAYLQNSPWRWTEKVDGTNIRLHFDGESISVGGRTDNAQIPGGLLFALARFNHPPLWNEVFADSTKVKPYEQDVTVYGEGYGPKIQSGSQYRTDIGFIVFDIRVGRWWLKPEDVKDAAEKLGMEVVPEYNTMTLNEAIGFVDGHVQNDWPNVPLDFKSHWLNAKPEGLVGTPRVTLLDRAGQRIIAKLKVADFEALNKRAVRSLQGEALADLAVLPGTDEARMARTHVMRAGG